MSIVKNPHFAHPVGVYLQNSIWTLPFAATFLFSILFTFTFIPLLLCFLFSYTVAIAARKFIINEVLPAPPNSAVIITGSSTGIGFDAALRLSSEGFTVFATVRKDEDAQKLKHVAAGVTGLKAEKIIPLKLEVTDSKQVETVVEEVKKYLKEKNLQLYGLVNNAGYSESGVIELMPEESLKKQFDVNLFAPIKLTQAFLPLLRQFNIQNYRPRIIFISSVAGKMSFAGIGVYCASKHALEAVGDALRQELKKWNISVSLVEPGAIKTNIASTSEKGLMRNLGKQVQGCASSSASKEVREHYTKSVQTTLSEFNKFPASDPSITSDVILSALLDSSPLPRYLAGRDAGSLPLLMSTMPQAVSDYIFGCYYR